MAPDVAKRLCPHALTNVTRKSRIALSYLVYYFPTKEAFLRELYRTLFGTLLSDITNHRNQPPVKQYHLLASYAFLEPAIPLPDRSIMLELVGLAVHNPRVSRHAYDYAQKVIDYLTELFDKTLRTADLSAEDAALLAASI